MKELKKAMKARMPKFIRSDAHKKVRLAPGWRRPNGLQNKMRLERKGYRVVVKTGYKTPLQNTFDGLAIVHVNTLNELSAINPKTQAITIGKLGRKNKEILIEAAKKKAITIVNLSVKKYQEKTKAIADQKAHVKKKRAEEEATKKKEQKEKESQAKKKEAQEAKAAEETPSTPEVDGETEKKLEEKKEKDKVLTSKKGY